MAQVDSVIYMDISTETREGQSDPPRVRRPNWGYLLLGLFLVVLVGGAYWLKTRQVPVEGTAGESQEVLMKAGLEALGANKPDVAAGQFRKVLALNPTHYGATYQLAAALDRTGNAAEARSYWEKMLPMAEAAKDERTTVMIRTRLQRPLSSAEQQAALMKAGLDALSTRKDPNAAVVEFRKVLALNPTHFGATYQLATALDRAGKPAEARPLWETVLKMAEGYNDKTVVATARARLARTP